MSEPTCPLDDPGLSESEQRYRAVIENAWNMIHSVRSDGSSEFVNRSWLDALGYEPDEVPQRNIWDIVPQDSVEHCDPLFTEALGGEPLHFIRAIFRATAERALNRAGMSEG